MSTPFMLVKHDGANRRCKPASPWNRAGADNSRILLSFNVPGWAYEDFQLECSTSDIVWMNTEAADWLESNGYHIHGSTTVAGIGYAADVKHHDWHASHPKDSK